MGLDVEIEMTHQRRISESGVYQLKMAKITALLCFLAWPVALVGGSVTARANNAGKLPSVKGKQLL